MQLQRLKFASYDQARSEFLPKLRGHVFHVTTPGGYEGIIKDGFILADTEESFPFTCSQSRISFFRRNGCVSLIDLRDVSDENLEDGLRKYPFLLPFSSGEVVLLILKEDSYPDIIPWTVSKHEGVGAMIVPYIESGYKDAISLSLIREAIAITVDAQPNPLIAYLDGLLAAP